MTVKCSSTTFSVVSPIFFSLLIIPRLVSYSLQTSSWLDTDESSYKRSIILVNVLVISSQQHFPINIYFRSAISYYRDTKPKPNLDYKQWFQARAKVERIKCVMEWWSSKQQYNPKLQPSPAQPSPARSHSCDIFTQALSNKHGDYTIYHSL